MSPERVPYQPGDAVDAALSLSVYEGARGAQLSGRIIDLHPAGLGPGRGPAGGVGGKRCAAARPLTAEERQLVRPTREETAAVYRELKTRRWHAEDLQPLYAKWAPQHRQDPGGPHRADAGGPCGSGPPGDVPFLELVRVKRRRTWPTRPS